MKDLEAHYSVVAQRKKLHPALVFLPLREQDQKIRPVLGPTLYTCLFLLLRPHPHRGGVAETWATGGVGGTNWGLS